MDSAENTDTRNQTSLAKLVNGLFWQMIDLA